MLQRQWYKKKPGWALVLSPLEWLYCEAAKRKRKKALLNQWQPPVPLVVVGNITLGGTGKSPLTITLIELLRESGYNPGVVSRGYGSNVDVYPRIVTSNDVPQICGDEPVMIVKRTDVPFVIDPNRVAACKHLLAHYQCDIILSDDGLQHYALGRDIEIAVIDGQRGLGNGHCIPVGPLREGEGRLASVDFTVVNGGAKKRYPSHYEMQLQPTRWHALARDESYDQAQFKQMVQRSTGAIHAFAGIGNPHRFFNALKELGVKVKETSFSDHYQYTAQDFSAIGDDILCMTEKDAVKCQQYAPKNSYYVSIDAQLTEHFKKDFCERVAELIQIKQRERVHGQEVT